MSRRFLALFTALGSLALMVLVATAAAILSLPIERAVPDGPLRLEMPCLVMRRL